jgi:hypothetical protein
VHASIFLVPVFFTKIGENPSPLCTGAEHVRRSDGEGTKTMEEVTPDRDASILRRQADLAQSTSTASSVLWTIIVGS